MKRGMHYPRHLKLRNCRNENMFFFCVSPNTFRAKRYKTYKMWKLHTYTFNLATPLWYVWSCELINSDKILFNPFFNGWPHNDTFRRPAPRPVAAGMFPTSVACFRPVNCSTIPGVVWSPGAAWNSLAPRRSSFRETALISLCRTYMEARYRQAGTFEPKYLLDYANG